MRTKQSRAIGSRIREKRLALGLTQQELAEAALFQWKSSICRMESGDREPTEDRLIRIAAVLHTTPEYLRDGTPEPPKPDRPIAPSGVKPDGRFIVHARTDKRAMLPVYPETARVIRDLAKTTGQTSAEMVRMMTNFCLERLTIKT